MEQCVFLCPALVYINLAQKPIKYNCICFHKKKESKNLLGQCVCVHNFLYHPDWISRVQIAFIPYTEISFFLAYIFLLILSTFPISEHLLGQCVCVHNFRNHPDWISHVQIAFIPYTEISFFLAYIFLLILSTFPISVLFLPSDEITVQHFSSIGILTVYFFADIWMLSVVALFWF